MADLKSLSTGKPDTETTIIMKESCSNKLPFQENRVYLLTLTPEKNNRRSIFKIKSMKHFAIILIAAVGVTNLQASPIFKVDVSQPVGRESSKLYGLMTEEINHSYDGGLYAELIRTATGPRPDRKGGECFKWKLAD